MPKTSPPPEQWKGVRECRCGCIVIIVETGAETVLRHIQRCGHPKTCDHRARESKR